MYFGSVKFFKHLIVTVLIVVFLAPTVSAIISGIKCTENSKKIEKMEETINTFDETFPDKLSSEVHKEIVDSVNTEKTAFQNEIENYVLVQVTDLNQQIDLSMTQKINGLDNSTSSRLSKLQTDLNSNIANKTSDLNSQIKNLDSSISARLEALQKRLDEYENSQETSGT
ncbi:MAG: hypothetical protein CVU91_08555 [Firmicutes bacterium HGW-Firmicutes-16]|nr:MAG: hypothetical protein CVU91_08555 [Firmicutes bacterium HGW-Firmicutes-16]